MAKQRRRTLALERLEDRWVPSNISYDGSNLTISNLTGSSPMVAGVGGGPTLAVTQQANGTFSVKVNSKIIQTPPTPPLSVAGAYFLDTTTGVGNGNYFVTGNLNINAGGGNLVIQVTLDNAAASSGLLPGNLNITTGNGNDTVILTTVTTGGATGGKIGGDLTVRFGSGADFFEAEPDRALGASGTDNLFIGGNVNISGKAGSANLAAVVAKGMEGFSAHNWAEFDQITTITKTQTVVNTIGGSVNVNGITEANIDAFNEPETNTTTIGGNVNVQESYVNSPAFANPDATGVPASNALNNNYVVLSVSARIGGSVSISGNTGSNYVLADSNIGGSLNVNFQNSNGNNTLDLNLNVPGGVPGAPMTIGQNVNFTAGNGNNTLLFDDSNNQQAAPAGVGVADPLLVGGSVNVSFGNGNNNYEFSNDSVAGGDVFINGNLSITAGNGSNNIATASPFALVNPGGNIPFLASVYGNESFNLGNGANTVDVGTAPLGSLYFRGGNGSNSFTLANAAVNGVGTTQTYNNFLAVFGNGSNTFTLGTPPLPPGTDGLNVVASGTAIGGTGTNLFVQNGDASPISVPWNLINFI